MVAGVVWDETTAWPPGIADQVRAASQEIRPAVRGAVAPPAPRSGGLSGLRHRKIVWLLLASRQAAGTGLGRVWLLPKSHTKAVPEGPR
jgi:hypothetical protein